MTHAVATSMLLSSNNLLKKFYCWNASSFCPDIWTMNLTFVQIMQGWALGDKQTVHPLWVLGLSHMKSLQAPGAWSLLPSAASVAIILYLASSWGTITLQNTIGMAVGHWLEFLLFATDRVCV